MFFTDLKELAEVPFKRLTGVRPATFLEMCDALQEHLPSGGREPILCLQDRLLMTLMYLREYRTQLHIGHTYGVSESTVSRTVRAVEDALMRSGTFHLPGKKGLTQSDVQYQIVVVDATECPVERPKKTASLLQRQEEASHPEGPSRRRYANQTDIGNGVQRGQDA